MDALQGLLSVLLEAVYEELPKPARTPANTLLADSGALLQECKKAFLTLPTPAAADVDALLAPAWRVLSLPKSLRKLNAAEEASFRKAQEAVPELRLMALDYVQRTLLRYDASHILDKLWSTLLPLDLDLVDFFAATRATGSKAVQGVVLAQLGARVRLLVAQLTEQRIHEPQLGRKRKHLAQHDLAPLHSIAAALHALSPVDLMPVFDLYQALLAIDAAERVELLEALVDCMVVRYAAEFHPLLPLLLGFARHDYDAGLLEHSSAVALLRLLVHPRRPPFPHPQRVEESPAAAPAAATAKFIPLPAPVFSPVAAEAVVQPPTSQPRQVAQPGPPPDTGNPFEAAVRAALKPDAVPTAGDAEPVSDLPALIDAPSDAE